MPQTLFLTIKVVLEKDSGCTGCKYLCEEKKSCWVFGLLPISGERHWNCIEAAQRTVNAIEDGVIHEEEDPIWKGVNG